MNLHFQPDHPVLSLAVYVGTAALYLWIVTRGNEEERVSTAPGWILYFGGLAFLLLGAGVVNVFAQTPDVTWDPFCEIYWWAGWPWCWWF